MRKYLIAGSSLATVVAAGSAGAVDVTLGGSIDMGVDFGLGKAAGEMSVSGVHNTVSLSIAAAGTTDGGLKYGGSFGIGTADELSFTPYKDGDTKYAIKATNGSHTDIEAAVYNVSGGGAIDAGNVVAVKINSEWKSVGGTATNYEETIGSFQSSNVCKLAGIGTNRGPGLFFRDFENYDDPALTDQPLFAQTLVNNQYWPAAQVGYIQKMVQEPGDAANTVSKYMGATQRLQIVYLQTNSINAGLSQFSSPSFMVLPENTGDENQTYFARYSKGYVKFGAPTGVTTSDDSSNVEFNTTENSVTNAQIFVGPFMEVQLASSSTKMVVGAVCLEGMVASDTMIYMNNASKVLTAGAASIYIEGGFGKLTLQSGDYAGAVSAIGGAGNAAGIDADGLVVVASGTGILGANPYLAMDLASGANLGNVELVAGGAVSFAGLSGAMDIELSDGGLASAIGTDIAAWDLGLTYQMGDLALAFATDSDNDWGLSASMDLAGFAVSTVFTSEGADDHEKSGIMYSVSAATSLNGFGLSIGFDQGLQPTVGLSYDLGALNVYAGYDAADSGGTAGVKLSF